MSFIKLSEEEKRVIKEMRYQNKGYGEIAKILSCSKERVKGYCRRAGLRGYLVSNPVDNALEMFLDNIKSNHPNVEYVSGYTHSESSVLIRCKECGYELKRCASFARRKKVVTCSKCKEDSKQKRDADKLKETKQKELYKYVKLLCMIPKSSLKEVHIHKCKQCAKLFGGKSNEVYCSEQCRKRHDNKVSEYRKRMRYKRAKANGYFDKSITLEKLFIRDKGLCYLCGDVCNWDDHKITEGGHFIVGKTYPTIEHVQAISRGGTHSWSNTKLACWKCNTDKNDKLFDDKEEQMSIFL